MSLEKWTAVDRYITDLLVPGDAALKGALADSAAAELPAINVTPNLGKFLWMLAKIQGARHILEIGTLGGYSTIWLARALPPGGKLVTLEIDPKNEAIARANIARAGLNDVVELRLGKALDSLTQIGQEKREPFDLVFIDADKPSNPEYFSWALKLTRRGSLIIVDNVVRDGEVINAKSQDRGVQGVRRFNEMLAAEPRVSATALQTVGSKGYDGFAIALVVAEASASASKE
jgi:predicted O-methyltransferase YrrM